MNMNGPGILSASDQRNCSINESVILAVIASKALFISPCFDVKIDNDRKISQTTDFVDLGFQRKQRPCLLKG